MNKELTTEPTVQSLIKIIREEILDGQQKAKTAFENERTLTYWRIGKHIHEHLLYHEDRADYGDYLLMRLAEELNVGLRTLYRTVQFLKHILRLCQR